MRGDEDWVLLSATGPCPTPRTPSSPSRGSLPWSSTRENGSSRRGWRILASSWGTPRGTWAPSTTGPGGPGATETSTNSQRYELKLIKTCGDTWRSRGCCCWNATRCRSSSSQSSQGRPEVWKRKTQVHSFTDLTSRVINLLVQKK